MASQSHAQSLGQDLLPPGAGSDPVGSLSFSEERTPKPQEEGLGFWFDISLGLAHQGNAHAQLHVASVYYDQVFDFAEAAKWFRMAAEQGLPLAQSSLASMYYSGAGVQHDCQEARKWFGLAAQQGDTHSQHNLATMYLLGECAPLDHIEAQRWFRLSAEGGLVGSQIELATMYLNGARIAQDYHEAEIWFRRAAEQGDPEAQRMLGEMFADGLGVAQDDVEATRWFKLAADQGDPKAQYFLGSPQSNDDVSGELSINLVVETAYNAAKVPSVGNLLLPDRETIGRFYIVEQQPVVSADDIVDARPDFARNGPPAVWILLDPLATERFRQVTSDNIGKSLAIVLNGEVISAPMIQSSIPNGEIYITGNFTGTEAANLANVVRLGE